IRRMTTRMQKQLLLLGMSVISGFFTASPAFANWWIVRSSDETCLVVDIEPSGTHTSGDLDTYLGDLVEEVHDEGLLSESELCGSFVDIMQQTASNQEVKDYLKENSGYFSGLPKLFASSITARMRTASQ